MLQPSNLRERSFYNGADVQATATGLGSAAGDTIGYSAHVWRNYSSIIDRVNPIGAGGFRSPGPCYHLKMASTAYSPYISGYTWRGTADHWGYSYSIPDSSHPMALPAEIEASLPQFPITTLLGLRLAAWKKFRTVMPETVSVANFLYELKDFEDVAKGLNKARNLKSVPKTKFSKVPTIANSTFLGYNFAWAPFIGDLVKMVGLMDSIPKRLDFLRRTWGKPTRVHFRADNPWSDPGPFDTPSDLVYWHREVVGSPYVDDHTFHYLRGSNYTSKFAASCTILQEVEGLNDAWTNVRAAYAALGLNNPLKVVWNAIPFSFILDWIAPVGAMLGLVAANPFPGRWDIYDVTNSLTESMTFDDYVYYYFNNPGSTGAKKIRSINVQRYQRWLSLQLTSDDVEFSSLTNHQQRLFASLIAGNTLFKG